MPGSGRRVAPPSAFGKNGGWELGWARARAPGEAERTRETPARCGLPPPPPPPGSAPPDRAVSKFRGERGGRGGRGGGARARCLPGGGARAAGGQRARAVPARSRALSPRLRSPGGRTRPPARGQDKERGGDPAGWPLPPLAAEPVPERAGARAPSRGAAVPRGGFRPEPASRARLPIGLPTPQGGSGCLRGGRNEVILKAGHIPSAGAGAGVHPGAPTRGQGLWAHGREFPADLKTNGYR